MASSRFCPTMAWSSRFAPFFTPSLEASRYTDRMMASTQLATPLPAVAEALMMLPMFSLIQLVIRFTTVVEESST